MLSYFVRNILSLKAKRLSIKSNGRMHFILLKKSRNAFHEMVLGQCGVKTKTLKIKRQQAITLMLSFFTKEHNLLERITFFLIQLFWFYMVHNEELNMNSGAYSRLKHRRLVGSIPTRVRY